MNIYIPQNGINDWSRARGTGIRGMRLLNLLKGMCWLSISILFGNWFRTRSENQKGISDCEIYHLGHHHRLDK